MALPRVPPHPGAQPRGRRSSPRPRPARRGRLAQLGPGPRRSGAVLAPAAPAAPAAPGRLPRSDRFGAGRREPPPVPALREAARVRPSGRGRGARGRGGREDTQAGGAGLGRPRGAGQGRAPRRPAPRRPAPRRAPGCVLVCPPPPRGHSHEKPQPPTRPFHFPRLGGLSGWSWGPRAKWVDSSGPAHTGLGVAAGSSLQRRRASRLLG